MTEANENPIEETGLTTNVQATPNIYEIAPALPEGEQRPSFLAVQPGDGYDDQLLREYQSPLRLMVAQAQSRDDVKRLFGEGDVYIAPSMVPVAEVPRDGKGRPTANESGKFLLVPLMFFPEFIRWNAIGESPAILERTTDPNSALAKRCKSFNPEDREDPVPGQENDSKKRIRCQEHLNFIFYPFGIDGINEPIVKSFSRSGFRDGKKLVDLIRGRKAKMFGCVFEAFSQQTKNDEGEWFKIIVQNPTMDGIGPWVSNPEWYAYLQQLHEQCMADYKAGRLQVEHDANEHASAGRDAGGTGSF
jgi:hypothetical protein